MKTQLSLKFYPTIPDSAKRSVAIAIVRSLNAKIINALSSFIWQEQQIAEADKQAQAFSQDRVDHQPNGVEATNPSDLDAADELKILAGFDTSKPLERAATLHNIRGFFLDEYKVLAPPNRQPLDLSYANSLDFNAARVTPLNDEDPQIKELAKRWGWSDEKVAAMHKANQLRQNQPLIVNRDRLLGLTESLGDQTCSTLGEVERALQILTPTDARQFFDRVYASLHQSISFIEQQALQMAERRQYVSKFMTDDSMGNVDLIKQAAIGLEPQFESLDREILETESAAANG